MSSSQEEKQQVDSDDDMERPAKRAQVEHKAAAADDDNNNNNDDDDDGDVKASKARVEFDDALEAKLKAEFEAKVRADIEAKLREEIETKIRAEAEARVARRVEEAEALRREAEAREARRVEELRREAEEQARLREEAEALRREAEAREARERQLRQGLYYATFDEVWDPLHVPYQEHDYNAMIRDKFPKFKASKTFPFLQTLEISKRTDLVLADDAESARGSHKNPDTRYFIWPVDVLHSEFDERDNPSKFLLPTGTESVKSIHTHSLASETGTSGVESNEVVQEIESQGTSERSSSRSDVTPPSESPFAHLVPASPQFASLYHHVAIWVFGAIVNKRNTSPRFIQKLIHGSKPMNPPVTTPATSSTDASTRKKLLMPWKSGKACATPSKSRTTYPTPAKSEDTPPKSRNRLGGLKHMICNKIRLAGQWLYFDTYPCVLIVPILTLKQAKEWNGQGYHAIFMISTGNIGVTLQRVASTVQMQDLGDVASKPEIAVAQGLLSATIKGLAYALTERSDERQKWVADLTDEKSKELLYELQEEAITFTGEKSIPIPTERQEEEKQKPVRKITFAPAFGPFGGVGHPAPDPLLLVVKAALNWCMFHGEKLMPATKDDDSDLDMSESSSLAAIQKLMAKQQRMKNARQDQEILNMTINIT